MGKKVTFRPGNQDAFGLASRSYGAGRDMLGNSGPEGNEDEVLNSEAAFHEKEAHRLWVLKMEKEGAKLIAQHWLACLGEMGTACLTKHYVPKMAENVKQVMAKGWGPHGPRNYEVKRHNTQRRSVALDVKNTLFMRYKGGWQCLINATLGFTKFVFGPYIPMQVMRKPRHATHFRLFVTIGGMCDFHFDPLAGAYLPLRPDILGLHDVVYSDLLPLGDEEVPSFELAGHLPGMPSLVEHGFFAWGMGVEFYHHGKGKLAPRLEMRVMMSV